MLKLIFSQISSIFRALQAHTPTMTKHASGGDMPRKLSCHWIHCVEPDFNRVRKRTHTSSMCAQMKNGALMASALHLFLTQLEPEENILP